MSFIKYSGLLLLLTLFALSGCAKKNPASPSGPPTSGTASEQELAAAHDDYESFSDIEDNDNSQEEAALESEEGISTAGAKAPGYIVASGTITLVTDDGEQIDITKERDDNGTPLDFTDDTVTVTKVFADGKSELTAGGGLAYGQRNDGDTIYRTTTLYDADGITILAEGTTRIELGLVLGSRKWCKIIKTALKYEGESTSELSVAITRCAYGVVTKTIVKKVNGIVVKSILIEKIPNGVKITRADSTTLEITKDIGKRTLVVKNSNGEVIMTKTVIKISNGNLIITKEKNGKSITMRFKYNADRSVTIVKTKDGVMSGITLKRNASGRLMLRIKDGSFYVLEKINENTVRFTNRDNGAYFEIIKNSDGTILIKKSGGAEETIDPATI